MQRYFLRSSIHDNQNPRFCYGLCRKHGGTYCLVTGSNRQPSIPSSQCAHTGFLLPLYNSVCATLPYPSRAALKNQRRGSTVFDHEQTFHTRWHCRFDHEQIPRDFAGFHIYHHPKTAAAAVCQPIDRRQTAVVTQPQQAAALPSRVSHALQKHSCNNTVAFVPGFPTNITSATLAAE